jgi:hypothetical protein
MLSSSTLNEHWRCVLLHLCEPATSQVRIQGVVYKLLAKPFEEHLFDDQGALPGSPLLAFLDMNQVLLVPVIIGGPKQKKS